MLLRAKIVLIVAIIILFIAAVAITAVFFTGNSRKNGNITSNIGAAASVPTDSWNRSNIKRSWIGKGCQIYPFEIDLHPIAVISGTNKFIYPKRGEKRLKIAHRQSLDFSCPGGTVILEEEPTNCSLLTGTCITEREFEIPEVTSNWEDLRCSKVPLKTIRYTGINCANKGKEMEAGFEIGNGRFLRSLLICFNQELQIAFYTFIKQTAAINQRVLDTPRPSFVQGREFYNIGTVNKLYLRYNQRATINRLLGLPDNSTKYIKDGGRYYLARGHLTARSDGFYAAQQNATFFYQNVAPQWQTFNEFNWNQIEIDVRDYAEDNGVDLHVWTGVYGVATLPHEVTHKPIDLYLFVNQTSNRKALPVPEILWKVAYNPVTQRGIAFIGLNNPYKATFVAICNDISHRLTWLHWKREDQQRGFCYACMINTFRKVVTSMPYIPDKGILF